MRDHPEISCVRRAFGGHTEQGYLNSIRYNLYKNSFFSAIWYLFRLEFAAGRNMDLSAQL